MKTFIINSMMVFLSTIAFAQSHEIRLLVRADDIGSFHAANVACIESYQNGIARSVELMVPCAWYPEAVLLLNENPGLDVGIHLVLTSEWSNVKWRPLTHCPSLVDSSGYFFPMVWKNDNFPPGSSLSEANYSIQEVEAELRAQIELALRQVPQISHLSCHMGFSRLDPGLHILYEQLAAEYILLTEDTGFDWFRGWGSDVKPENRIEAFCENLEQLKPGDYFFLDHPAKDDGEMQTVGHKGYENVAVDREWVTRVFTCEKVKEIIRRKNIKLISYADLATNLKKNE